MLFRSKHRMIGASSATAAVVRGVLVATALGAALLTMAARATDGASLAPRTGGEVRKVADRVVPTLPRADRLQAARAMDAGEAAMVSRRG